MKLFWCEMTRASRLVWLLEEMGLSYERVRANVRDPQSITDPDFKQASPMGKVPALVDGDVKMWDSCAIALYLADAYPETGFGVPIGHPDRGRFLTWTFYTNTVVEPALAEKFAGTEPTPERSGFGSYDLMVKTLVDGLKPGPWILGEKICVADILLASNLDFLQKFNMMPDVPEFVSYLEASRQRPAYQRAMALEAQ